MLKKNEMIMSLYCIVYIKVFFLKGVDCIFLKIWILLI